MPSREEMFIQARIREEAAICLECGAWVEPSRTGIHCEWHARLKENGAERPKREDYSEG